MRVLRVMYQDKIFHGALEDKTIRCLNTSLGLKDPVPLSEVQVLPAVMPTKVVCVGLNYHGHAREMNKEVPNEPLLFLKPPSAVIGTGEAIICPAQSQDVHYEGELAVVMGKVCRKVKVADVPDHVFGFTCANDVTARDLQNRDVQYTRAKGFDTFCPIGPWIETAVKDPGELTLRTRVNQEVRQEESTRDMIVSPYELVSYVSGIMTLMPGDIILTGTPSGVGTLHPGDEVHVEIDKVGVLMNRAIAESETD